MYSFLVRLAHGFTLVPLILAFKQTKLFSYLKTPKSLDQILNFSKLNSGYVNAGLKLLLIFSIIEKRKNKYLLVNDRVIKVINKDFIIFYNQSFTNILSLKKNIKIINKYSTKLIKGWKIKSFQNELLSGPFLIPIIFCLKFKKNYLKKVESKEFLNLKNVLLAYNMIKIEKNKKIVFSSVGKYLINNIYTIGVAASYKKMLFSIPYLLEHDPNNFFKKNLKTENHIDRELNIASSSSQHNKYFNEILNLVENIYKKKNKPKYIMDIGCGDGWLLKKIFERIKEVLPEKEIKKIKLIGIDLNNISILRAKKNLKNTPALFIKSSIDNPDFIFKKLKEKKINKDLILHIRSFIDHERKINFSKKIYNSDDIINQIDQDIDGIDSQGKNIQTEIINKSLDEFYSRWSKYIGKFGLINLEVFKQSVKKIKKNLDLNEGAHFDFIQTFSGQNLCKAKMQLYCMARNNLFPKILKAYPESTSFKRILLGYFIKQKFSNFILNRKAKKNKFYFSISGKNVSPHNKFTKSLIVRNYKKYISFFDRIS